MFNIYLKYHFFPSGVWYVLPSCEGIKFYVDVQLAVI